MHQPASPAQPGRADAGLTQGPDAFVENFVGQWLDLRQIDFTLPDRKLYPEFDDILKAAMVGETHAFFAEMLRDDSKLSNFIHSDFLMLNRCIAEHYQIDGVTGEEFRRVPLPADCHRGGVLTQASVLKVTANGTFTSPVLRGAWVMRRLLGEPPDPPPADIPAFEPDTRGATSIRQQLAKHRSLAKLRVVPCPHRSPRLRSGELRRDRRLAQSAIAPRKGTRRRDRFRGRHIWEYRLGPAGRRLGRADRRPKIQEHRRLQATAASARGSSGSQPDARISSRTPPAPGIQFADRDVVDAILTRRQVPRRRPAQLVHEIVQSQTFQTK